MIRQFHKEFAAPYQGFKNKFVFLDVVWLSRWTNILSSNSGMFIGMRKDRKPAGVLGGVLYRDLNDNALCAMESFWYVFAEYRGRNALRLIDKFEEWAKELDVKRITMASLDYLDGEIVGKIYARKGYLPTDRMFTKSV